VHRGFHLIFRILAGAALLQSVAASAATQAQIDAARTSGLAWLYQHQQGDGGWGSVPGLAVQSTSAAVNALLNAGVQTGNTYNAAVSRLANVDPSSVDGMSRKLDTLMRTGTDVSAFASRLQSSRNIYKAWGSLPGYGYGPADTALALSALLDAVPTYTNNDVAYALCSAILPTQHTGGGWSYLGGGTGAPASATPGAIIPTAYAILVLQKINTTRFTGLSCSGTPYTFTTSINNGIAFLLTKQNADNGFGENGTSGALETALAYMAISGVNPAHAALGPARDDLIATQQPDGSWAGDPFQTALALQSFPATTLTDTAQDGIPDVVKVALGINVNDGTSGRALRPGNGQSITGTTAPIALADLTTNQSASLALTGSGGTPPYSYTLLSGKLPDGMTLASDGTISGTPTTAGQFNFIYELTDSLGAPFTLAGQITVSATPKVVPALPVWGSILFALMLLGSGIVTERRRTRHS